ncbi:MAG: hypothetical protein CME06_06280 [Gemmatimonadetes bacterium]|nr:hypothetical protein [Gemmatimonadota bacterium]
MGFAQELKRKSIHLAAISIPVLYYWIPSDLVSKWLLVVFTLLFFWADLIKLRSRRGNRIFMAAFARFLRRHETRELNGATFVMLAAAATILCLSKPVATAAMAFLVLGDTAAALVGKSFGRLRYLGKSVEGSVACFLACMLAVWVIPDISIEVGLAGAAAATIAELVPIPIDDNFRIPLAAGGLMQLMS